MSQNDSNHAEYQLVRAFAQDSSSAASSGLHLEAAARFRSILLGLAIIFCFGLLLRRFALYNGTELHMENMWALELSLGTWAFVSLALYFATRNASSPRWVLNAALFYEVALCADMAGMEHMVFQFSSPPPRLSVIAIPILVFPMMIPSSRIRRVMTTTVSALMLPFGALSTVWYTGEALPPGYTPLLYAPTFLCAALAIYLSSIIHQLHRQAGRAQRLGSYELHRKIGEGAMGEVWEAKHQLLSRPAAIKLVRPDSNGNHSEVALRRFEREAQATSVLSSPHTVAIYDFGRTNDGAFYYAMELLDGLNLETLINRFGPVPPERAIHFLIGTCQSLAEAHDHDLIHRDIKPANLLSCHVGSEYDFIKVLDFGLVKSVLAQEDDIHVTRENVITGTPAYMAPEVALGKTFDERIDIYSLGCVGFWLLTGRLVFEGESAMEVAVYHAERPAPSPAEFSSQEIPSELCRLLQECLEKSPTQRPASIRVFRERLSAIETGQNWTQARATDWWSRAREMDG